MSTAAMYAYATEHGIPLDLPGQRVPYGLITPGTLTLDPGCETFLPEYVRVDHAYPHPDSAGGRYVLVVRPVRVDGSLGPSERRTVPADTYVTVWAPPVKEATAS
jgi:hypothetical protein